MKTISVTLLLLGSLSALAQTAEEQKEYVKLVWDQNLPEDLRNFYNKGDIKNRFELNTSLNPFYLRGDFNGDNKLDYALAIVETKSNKKGILLYHPAIKTFFVVGAGTSIPNGYGDDYRWMDAWEVSKSKKVGQGISEAQPPKLRGEAILVQKLESSSGLIYWDGKGYKWYPQGD